MSDLYHNLSHSKWDCKYHVVFIPKKRRHVLYQNLARELGKVFHELAGQKGCRILEGHIRPDHVHMCIEIPPKVAVSSIIGFNKGKSAFWVTRQVGKEKNFSVSTVGFELEQIRAYIRDQQALDDSGRF